LIGRWIIIVGFITVSLILGYIGFSKYFQTEGIPRTPLDLLYLTLQLLTMESGAVTGKVNLELQIARYLAPLAAASAIIQAFLTVFAGRVQQAWLRMRGDHVVVCGLGRKGARLVQELCDRGERVVVIEPDEKNRDALHCRELGAIVLTGAANDVWMLRKAGLLRAKTIIAVAGDDGTNVETAVRAHEVNQHRRSGKLRCVVHVADPGLQTILKQHEIFADQADRFEMELFNSYEIGARAMLREPPLMRAYDCQSDQLQTHLLIIGLGHLGQTLLSRAVRDWKIDRRDDRQLLKITGVDADALDKRRWLELHYPTMVAENDFRFVDVDIRDPAFSEGSFLTREEQQTVTAAYICLDDDSLATFAALTLRRILDVHIPIIVRMSEEAGLATLLGTELSGNGAIDGVRAIGLMDIACRLDAVLGGNREILAQAIHQNYLQDQLVRAMDEKGNPAIVSWQHLPENLKESNRQQADQIVEKLAAIGCKIVACPLGEVELIDLAAEEIEYLAEMEHKRFVQERIAAGWRLGEKKDIANRISPHLISWSELAEEIRDNDRNAVRRLPAVLAKADFAITRR
jgi:hypothetical protein